MTWQTAFSSFVATTRRSLALLPRYQLLPSQSRHDTDAMERAIALAHTARQNVYAQLGKVLEDRVDLEDALMLADVLCGYLAGVPKVDGEIVESPYLGDAYSDALRLRDSIAVALEAHEEATRRAA